MADTVENAGTNIFGNNAFGRFLNEINPMNIGLSNIFKSADETLNAKKKQ